MATPARDRLAGLLGGELAPGAPSVTLTAKPDDLHLAVEGIGRVQLPVPVSQARQLCRLGQPARFGRGEETLTDPRVRDTWEIPKGLVRIEWRDAFGTILNAVRDGLGLPRDCELAADFHSMLVYGRGQFFVAHQDSEKDDSMIATLVVMLPSGHTGGALVIDPGGEAVTYRGSKSALSLVAFYSDCRHEVRPVKSGYRVTLTYNLLLQGNSSGPIAGDDATIGEFARCLDEHFATPAASTYGRAETDPPKRLVYLLDQEYTVRGLSWSRLKGTDARRASLLRAAADRSGCEAVLALADIQETWAAYESEPVYGYRDWDDVDDEEYWGEERGAADDDLEEFIESSVRLTHWIGPSGARSEEISLIVDDSEVCATTRSADLQPYNSEYEGYMGNYGNTMDRWYRRAAVVVWPRDLAFRNQSEASPAWALGELGARARAGDLAGARAAAATLAPFWDIAVRARGDAESLLHDTLRTGSALDDAETAGMLLRPFHAESLRPDDAEPLVELAEHYGERWVGELVRTWFGDWRAWPFSAGQNREEWITSLPGLCEALHAKGHPGTAIAHRLLDLSWSWVREAIGQSLATQSPSRRDKRLGELGQPLAGVLPAAAVTGAASFRDEVVGFIRQHGDEVLACVMPALRAAAELPPDTRRNGGFDQLAIDAAARLRARLARPPRADDDWSFDLPDGCACELCGSLGGFVRDPAQRAIEWPLAKEGRRHIHSRIDDAELPVRHATRRQGRPYTLVLTKTQALFETERQARLRDEADLAWLNGEWSVDDLAPLK